MLPLLHKPVDPRVEYHEECRDQESYPLIDKGEYKVIHDLPEDGVDPKCHHEYKGSIESFLTVLEYLWHKVEVCESIANTSNRDCNQVNCPMKNHHEEYPDSHENQAMLNEQSIIPLH